VALFYISDPDPSIESTESPAFLLVEKLINNDDRLLQTATHESNDTPHSDPTSPWDAVKDKLAFFDPAQAWDGLLNILKTIVEKVKGTVGPPFTKATQAVREFYAEHPSLAVAAAAVIVLACLGILFPPFLAAIGFGAQGVIKGSLAAAWQACYYGAYIPARCIFSILQRLGATIFAAPPVVVFTAITIIVGVVFLVIFAFHAESNGSKTP